MRVKKTYKLEELDCPMCAAKMEAAVSKLDGVTSASVSFLTQKITVEAADGADYDALMQKVAKACKRVEPDCKILL